MMDAGTRPDDPLAVMEHKDRFYGGKALIVLGGPSGKGWEKLAAEIRPDVILTANGATHISGAEYWMLSENMSHAWHDGKRGDQRMMEFIRRINMPNAARFRLVNYKSIRLIKDKTGILPIARQGYDVEDIPDNFSLRTYDKGYLNGARIRHTEVCKNGVVFRVGTVGLQLLHHAGILGCFEAHTIGFDLMFKGLKHHWYDYPAYQDDYVTNNLMFVSRNYEGKTVETRWTWVETAEYLKAIEYLFERDELVWRDHSDGLLKYEGLRCANG